MIAGVSKVVVDVDDQDQAKAFWTDTLGFDLVQDTPYGDERWLEVRTPDKATVLVLSPRHGEPRRAVADGLPTSSAMFYADDLRATYEELRGRGVAFHQEPVEMGFGWWSVFMDPEGNRYALVPRGQ